MNQDNEPGSGADAERGIRHYFPAIICVECDSPIDALVALCVPRDEAMDLVAASWPDPDAAGVLATVDGGRPVAALRTPAGRWAACNVFPDPSYATHGEAERELKKLLKRGRRGVVASTVASAVASSVANIRVTTR